MALTSLCTLKAFLNVPQADSSKDRQYAALLAAADEQVKAYVGRRLEYAASRVEIYEASGTRFITLRERPVYAVNNLWFDLNAAYGFAPTAFQPSTLLTAGTDYALALDGNDPAGVPWSAQGLVMRVGTNWQEVGRSYFPGKLTGDLAPALGTVKVDYAAGYQSGQVPQDLQYAVCYVASYMRRTVKLGAEVHTEKLGQYSYELKPTRWDTGHPDMASAIGILRKYKEPAFGYSGL